MRLAKQLVEAESGPFEPEKLPDKYAETLRELLRAKVEQRAPQIEVASEGKATPEVINIMAALKESMHSSPSVALHALMLVREAESGSLGSQTSPGSAFAKEMTRSPVPDSISSAMPFFGRTRISTSRIGPQAAVGQMFGLLPKSGHSSAH